MKETIARSLTALLFFICLSPLLKASGLPAGNDSKVRQVAQSPFVFSDTASAVFSSRTSLVLNTDVPLVRHYKANIASLSFLNEADAEMFFNKITDNLLSYKLNFTAGTVTITIHTEYANPGWTVSDWNNYIHNKLNP